MIQYRNYEITKKWVTMAGPPQPDEWTYIHKEYTGGDPYITGDCDHRSGYGTSLENCKEQIDAMV